jgi:two-component system sensor histidine kinase AlgZ
MHNQDMPVAAHRNDDDDFFLPNFCNVQALLSLVIVAELLVLVLELASKGLQRFNWTDLGLSSFFVQWLVLLSAALLCNMRGLLRRLPLLWGVAVSYLLILLLTLLLSIAAQALLPVEVDWQWDMGQILSNVIISAVMAGIALRYFYLQQLLRRQQQAELHARIEALQARIRPHFLFNSMNIIASLIAVDPDTAEQVVEDLSELFRASLQVKNTTVTFAEELDLCQKYVGIEQLRLGERLQVEWQLDTIPQDLQIPSLILQPLLENAIYHGIQPLPEGGLVRVQGEFRDAQCLITISNPLPKQGHQQAEGNHMAVDNIRHRLAALYGKRARLSLQSDEDHFVTSLSFPDDALELRKL